MHVLCHWSTNNTMFFIHLSGFYHVFHGIEQPQETMRWWISEDDRSSVTWIVRWTVRPNRPHLLQLFWWVFSYLFCHTPQYSNKIIVHTSVNTLNPLRTWERSMFFTNLFDLLYTRSPSLKPTNWRNQWRNHVYPLRTCTLPVRYLCLTCTLLVYVTCTLPVRYLYVTSTLYFPSVISLSNLIFHSLNPTPSDVTFRSSFHFLIIFNTMILTKLTLQYHNDEKKHTKSL